MTKKTKKQLQDMSQALSQMKKSEDINNFLLDLLSLAEIEEFSRRLRVAQMLSEGMSYQDIEKKTKMSSTTIARISKFLR